MSGGPIMLGLSQPAALLLAPGLGAISDWAYHIGGVHLAAAQLFALVVGVLPASALAIGAGATLGVAVGFALVFDAVGRCDFDVLFEPLAVPPRYRTLGRRTRARCRV